MIKINKKDFIGFSEEINESFNEEKEKEKLLAILLQLIVSENKEELKQSTKQFLDNLQNQVENFAEIKPALLWDSEELKEIKGTYLYDRVKFDLKHIQKLISDFHINNPTFRVFYFFEFF